MRCTVSVYYFPEDDDEGPTFKEKFMENAMRTIDTLCVWDCCWLWLTIQKYMRLLVFDPFTELFITLCIVVNTLFMALDHHDMDREMEKILKSGNYVRTTFYHFIKVSTLKTMLGVLVFFSNFRNRSYIEVVCNESKILFSRRLEYF